MDASVVFRSLVYVMTESLQTEEEDSSISNAEIYRKVGKDGGRVGEFCSLRGMSWHTAKSQPTELINGTRFMMNRATERKTGMSRETSRKIHAVYKERSEKSQKSNRGIQLDRQVQ